MYLVSVSLRSFAPCLVLLLASTFPSGLFGYTKSGKVYTTNGSQSDVNAAIGNASAGDTVNIPAGRFSWGANNVGTTVNKAITLQGAGRAQTTINQTADSGGLIYVSAGLVQGFTVNQSSGRRLLVCSGGDGWRFTNLQINGVGTARIFDIDKAYGLIDHCTIDIYAEQIFMYGRTDAWTTDSTMGTDQAVYFEDCTFTGSGDGYTDANANAKMVFRRCTCTHMIKFDAHGVWSDSPAHSARHIEVYQNNWTAVGEGSFQPTVELRGGTARIFFNSAADNTFQGRGILKFYEYGTTATGGSFGNRYQTPAQRPILDQVGRGKNQAAEPAYVWGNRKGGIYPGGKVMPFVWDYPELSGSSDPTLPNGFPMSLAPIQQYRTDIGAATKNNPTTPNQNLGSWLYRLTGTPSSSMPYNSMFTMKDVIVADADYFAEPYDESTVHAADGATGVPFDGSTGVGIGTKAQMLAIKPTKNGVGYWVTDEGSWDTTVPANTSGRLYAWNGSAWVVIYTPYTYPHPLTSSAPRPNPPANLRVK